MELKLASKESYIDRIFDQWLGYQPVLELVEKISDNENSQATLTGLSGSSEAFLIASLKNKIRSPILIVTESTDNAQNLVEDLDALIGPDQIGFYPSRQILPYDFKAPVGEIIGHRISTLAGLLEQKKKIIVCTIRSLLEPTIPKLVLDESSLVIRNSDELDMDEFAQKLVLLGFNQVPVVEEVGGFAKRGGLIDFFTPGSEYPVRIEFFGDEIDTIREFDVQTQRTIRQIQKAEILPKREIPITQENLEKYLESLPEEDADFIRFRYLNDPELPGLEWLSVMFGLEQGTLIDYLTDDTIVYYHAKGNLKAEAESILKEAQSLHDRLKPRISSLPKPEDYYLPIENIFTNLDQHRTIDKIPFKGGRDDIISFDCNPHPALASRIDLLGDIADQFRKTEIEYFVAVDNKSQGERLQTLVTEKAKLTYELPVEEIHLHNGFVCQSGGFAVLTDHEIFSRHHRRTRRKKFKEGVAISDYSNLTVGDHVVHTDHGIAKYLGLKTLHVDKRNRDCLLLQYAEKDKLYVPIEEFNRVSKYSGKDAHPSLSRLGGQAWEKLKTKTKKAIEDIAKDLILLYAARKHQDGFSFGEDTVWLKQLESSFPFEETVDQQKAIDDVKRDMVLEKPMDRLICGDVGYGKTEVAVRAAFKAVDAGKQVAVLVPTTVLAQQHFQTFSERMAEFPVKIGLLSRFRTRKQQLETVKEISEGKVDLVIGTHRLFSKDVSFKDLGLLIIDEEHRFGVKHKERLRQLKTSVDSLAMTATPIPRTLQMSLMGARDMSIIETSPKDRLPIITEIIEFDPGIIATTILREMNRNGQVFFLHNRVQTIEAMYRYLKKIVPQAEIGVAHGQMHERSLEGVMMAFMDGKFDVLLCTSIIESGLDIPKANTIIINRADRFGLAELYQIRGRVGRSSERAYAYLMTPPTRRITADAMRRLRALEAHSDLGAGFALAMRDLEIRGAGTILGAKQSGFIEEIGFDLYNRLLEEAVAELKGHEIVRLPETKLEIDFETHLSEQYIPDNHQKVDIYRRLADAINLDQVEKIRDEVADRFGNMPQSAINLIDATAVKISAAMLEVEKLSIKSDKAHIFFIEERKLTRSEVESFRKATDQPMEFSLLGRPRISIELKEIEKNNRLSFIRSVLNKII